MMNGDVIVNTYAKKYDVNGATSSCDETSPLTIEERSVTRHSGCDAFESSVK